MLDDKKKLDLYIGYMVRLNEMENSGYRLKKDMRGMYYILNLKQKKL